MIQMSIQIRKLNHGEYEKLLNNESGLPIWLLPKLATCYEKIIFLSAYRGNRLVGVWLVPLVIEGRRKMARRKYRCFPYSSPYLTEGDNLKRRSVVYKLFEYLTNYCDDINLPFAPEFKEFAPIQGLGGFVEWRHTHILKNPIEYRKLSSKLRNHIRNARRLIRIEMNDDSAGFNFEEAIKGPRTERLARKKSAINLLENNHAKIFSAYLRDKKCGGILIATDSTSAYIMHSWRSKDAPRGTVSALIFEGADWALGEKRLKRYDFEGSILQKVDYYYSGFNCKIAPYGHVFWSKDKESLHGMIEKAMNIPERLIKT